MEHGIIAWLGVVSMAFALAMDAFAVSIATGIKVAPPRPWQTIRISACFGFFQFFMPVLGWLAGHELVQTMKAWDHWIAFGLLAAVGLKMIYDALSSDDASEVSSRNGDDFADEKPNPCSRKKILEDPTLPPMILMLGLATSIDAFAVGMSMAMMDSSIWIPCLLFGLVAAAMSVVGMRYGGRIGRRTGREAEIAGGLVLILIGLVTLVSHLMGG
ncbi:MAG: manganese efflux pump [Pirellulales bacterium]|nr:manganese efflux pump [Pirellulales bacterium]